MRVEIIDEGFIAQCRADGSPGSIAVGPRLVVRPDGTVLCSFMRTAALATNDFVPVLFGSVDDGRQWQNQGAIWPHLKGGWSLFVSISQDSGADIPVCHGRQECLPHRRRRLFLFGTRCAIDQPGESFWNDATQGLKQNELVWAMSEDGGATWSEPVVIPMPIPGSAEAPGPLCVCRSGRWLAVYSPSNTFDSSIKVDRSQVVFVYSDDEGRTWRHTSMLRFADAATSAAEAWVVELSDGRLLGTCWHVAHCGGDLPNAFAISHDGGTTWTLTRSTGILGQSTALAPWVARPEHGGEGREVAEHAEQHAHRVHALSVPPGRAIFLYNQRKHGEVGVWLAVVRPSDTDFGVEHNEIIWRAETPTRTASSGDLEEWSDFSFGEPSAVRLPDGTWLAALWCVQPSGAGIRYIRFKLDS